MRTGAALLLILAALEAQAALVAENPFPAPEPSEFERSLIGGSVFVKRIRVEGAVSLSAERVADVVRPYENRRLGAVEIREIQQRLTRLYIDSGYVTSGVVVQEGLQGDELVLRAIEGTVKQVRFAQAPRWSRPQYLTRLLVPDDEEPVHLGTLQERLAALRDAGVIDRIDAELVPMAKLGDTELVVSVEEPRPFGARIDYDNHHPPAVGARRATIYAWDRNLTGWGDSLDLRYGDTPGLLDALASYVITIPYTRVRVGARYERSDSLAIEPQFRALDIKSHTTTESFELGYTLRRRASSELTAFTTYDRRRGDTTLLGLPFSFITGIDDGVTRITAWRVGLIYSARGESSVLFARVHASDGKTNVAEDPPIPGKPATRFRSWFAQAQYAWRLPFLASQAIGRLEAQHTGDVLLPMEKYALGGSSTVRGYRENLLLRDRAVLGSLEWQVPLTPSDWKWRATGALFGDAAWSRNVYDANDTLPRQISSVGTGLIVEGPWGLSGRIYFAWPNRRWLTPNDDMQDRGIHFALSWEATKLIP